MEEVLRQCLFHSLSIREQRHVHISLNRYLGHLKCGIKRIKVILTRKHLFMSSIVLKMNNG